MQCKRGYIKIVDGNGVEVKSAYVNLSYELSINTLDLSILKATKYSSLKDMLKGREDYPIEEGSGKVYSDMISLKQLPQIRRNVNASFFTIPVILRIIKKLVIERLLTLILSGKGDIRAGDFRTAMD
jgi:hypothetical protein